MDIIREPFARRFLASYLAAWNRRDPDGLLSLAARDVRWEDPSIPGGGVAEGTASVRSWLVGFWRAFPDMTFDHVEPGRLETAGISLDGRTLIAPWRCRGTFAGPLDPPGLAPNGARIALLGVDAYQFREEQLAHVRTIVDLQDGARQLGLLPPAGGWAERVAAVAQRLLMRARLAGWRAKPAGPR